MRKWRVHVTEHVTGGASIVVEAMDPADARERAYYLLTEFEQEPEYDNEPVQIDWGIGDVEEVPGPC